MSMCDEERLAREIGEHLRPVIQELGVDGVELDEAIASVCAMAEAVLLRDAAIPPAGWMRALCQALALGGSPTYKDILDEAVILATIRDAKTAEFLHTQNALADLKVENARLQGQLRFLQNG